MKPKTIEEVLERVKTWPEIAQADLAQAALGIEADLEKRRLRREVQTHV